MRKALLLTFDVEEFDWPLDFGHAFSFADQLTATYEGMQRLLPLLDKHAIRGTFFITGAIARAYPQLLRALVDAGHETAVHGLAHEDDYRVMDPAIAVERLRTARELVEAAAGRPAPGFRSPLLRLTDPSVLRAAGFSYDASPHPTWVPGRYNGLRWPRSPWREAGILRV